MEGKKEGQNCKGWARDYTNHGAHELQKVRSIIQVGRDNR